MPGLRALVLLLLATVLATACSEKAAPTAAEDAPEVATPEPATAWWDEDNPCPDGTLMRADKPVSSIHCETDKKRHGRYAVLRSDGVTPRVLGAFVHGKRDGTWRQFDPAGKELGSFELRQGTGTVVEWLDSGAISMRFDKVDGARAGTWIKYYNQPVGEASKPTMQEKGAYDNDARDGTWTFWSPAGVIEKEIDYTTGRVLETRTFENGVVVKTEKEPMSGKMGGDVRRMALRGGVDAKLGSALARLKGKGGTGIGTGIGAGIGGPSGGPSPTSKRRGRIKRLEVVAIGALDRQIVARTLRTRHRALKSCYERELMRDNALKGKIVVRFQISDVGTVRRVKSSGLGNERVESCFSRQIGRIKFPRPQTGVVKVKASYVLQSSG